MLGFLNWYRQWSYGFPRVLQFSPYPGSRRCVTGAAEFQGLRMGFSSQMRLWPLGEDLKRDCQWAAAP
jgi:hypothetical protein